MTRSSECCATARLAAARTYLVRLPLEWMMAASLSVPSLPQTVTSAEEQPIVSAHVLASIMRQARSGPHTLGAVCKS